MEIDEFIETETGKKAIKAIEEQKKELYDNWGYTKEELDHIELCMLRITNEMYLTSEEWEEDARHYLKIIDKYRKLLLQIADAAGVKSTVVDSTSVMEEAMFYTLPQEIRQLKERADWN
jgi:hypothetical protein